MKLKQFYFTLLFGSLIALQTSMAIAHEEHDHSSIVDYQVSSKWTSLSNGQFAIGKSHGEIDIAKNGNFYLSLMSTPQQKGGVHIYSPDGKRIGQVPNAPDDFHGFVIHQDNNGLEYIYGASLKNQEIVKMTLSGNIVFTLDATQLIPKNYHKLDPNKPRLAPIKLTAIDVDRDGNMYVVDGYSLDYIHKFSAEGKYLTSFGGKNAPYLFNNCHKIHIDPRYQPNRLICTDRNNGRLVHMQLDGKLIGTYANSLRRPSAVDFFGDLAAVAEISGRVSLLDKSGKIVSTLGTNEVDAEINTNVTQPAKWRNGIFTAPHGITFDHQGNLFISEWNKWGRIVRFDRQH